MRTRSIALSALAVPLAFTLCSRPAAIAQPVPAAAASQYGTDQDAYRDAHEQGHRDGMKAAYHDMHDNRSPDPKRHDEYRHPPVDGHARDAYRDGFRDGYKDAIRNAQQGGPQGDYDRH